MYPITSAVKALYDAEQRQVLRITGTDKNGATISITDANVMENGFTIDRYSCNGTKLEVGTAIASEMTLKLDNRQGQFDGIAFEGAELFVEVGIADWTQDSPTVNWMPCGYFTPYLQPRKYSTITLNALDRMMKFDRVVEAASLTLPATVAGLVAQVCALFGITLAAAITGFPNASYSVSELPELQQTITYRNLIQWCAGIMGTNAWMDWNGQLRFSWYDNATGYETTAANRFSSDLHEDDITITGVQYTNTQDATIIAGTDDYALDLTGNYLAASGIAAILPTLNTALNGFTYRPFTATVTRAPYLWPMDAITFTDRGGNDHATVLTNVNFSLNGVTAIESHGETAEANSGTAPSGVTPMQGFLIEKAKQAAVDEVDESLTQEEVFNRLTDNGAAQGLYIDPNTGQIYVNASYIRSGTLILGGLNNESGVLEVHDENDNVIGTWDKDGADITDGSITTYSQDRQHRAIVSDGIIAIQYYESAVQPIGWRDMIRLNMNSSNDAQIRARNNLYVTGYGGILNLTNKSGTTDEAYANVELNEDQAELLAKDTDVGEASIRVNPDVITFTIDDNTIGPPSVFELSNYQSDNPLSVGNGGTGANTAAAARANLGITPANIGAIPSSGGTVTGAIARKVDVDFESTPTSTEWSQIIPITDDDNAVRGGVYMRRNTDGSYEAIYGAYKAGVGWNYIAPKINADGTFAYDVNRPEALRSAIGLGNANNPVVLVQADSTVSAIYNKLSALPLSPANGAGVPCHISPNAMNLLTGGKVTSAELVGLITRTSTNGYRIFGTYGATGYMMYWSVTVTNSAITPNTVFKLQGTAM